MPKASVTDLKTITSNVKSLVEGTLADTGGLLRLAPAWVPRSFLQPGLRIKLHPDDTYAYGLNRGGIDERWFASTTETANDAVMQPETRQLWRRIVNQGWTDALRALHPNEPKLYTFWDYTAGCWQRDLGFRLDHLLCSPEAADRLRAAGVDKWARAQEKASDHAPTWVELS